MSVSLPLNTLPECLDAAAPIAVRAVDLELQLGHLQLPISSSGAPYRRMVALVRLAGRPLGWTGVDVPADGRVELDAIALQIDPVASDGSPRSLPLQSLLSVVVSTCAEVDATLRCVDSILRGDDGRLEVVVVENRPAISAVRGALADRFGIDRRVRYLEESRRGLASARNAGLRAARGDVIAFTDDDVVVDPGWIRSLREAFAAQPEVGCVTGLILPLELETPTQLLVERFASYAKGFLPREYALDRPPADQPLFPYTAGYFGSGANVAFRAEVIRELNGFDSALGTGTSARGGEDLDVFLRVLQSGRSLAYEPRAMVWHRHPADNRRLRLRAFDYGTALGATLTKQLAAGPRRRRILSLAPQGLRYLLSPASRKNAGRTSGFPRALVALELAGVLWGPLAYLVSVLRTRR
jgi:O-antigen biosynthesis protein